MARKRNPVPEKYRVGKAQLVEEFGVSDTTISNWQERHGFPKHALKGTWDRRAIGAWLANFLRTLNKRHGTKAAAKVRIDEAEASLKELKLAKERGELVPREVLQHSVDGAVAEAKGIAENTKPLMLAAISPEGKYDRDELAGIIGKQIERMLLALSRGGDLPEGV